MKSIKYFIMLLFAGVFPFVMSSCLYDDDDNNKVTQASYKKIAGNYTGSVQFLQTVDDKTDVKKVEGVSMAITTDSTITVTGVPAEAFTENIKDEAIKSAIAAQASPLLKAKFYIYATADDGAGFFVYPVSVEFKNVTVGESTHDYVVTFYQVSDGSASIDGSVSIVGVKY